MPLNPTDTNNLNPKPGSEPPGLIFQIMPNGYMSYMEEQQDLNYREAEQHQRQKLAEHEANQEHEGDLEQRQAEQEQAARLAEPKDWQPTNADIEAFRRGAASAVNAAEHDPEYATPPKRTVQDWYNDRMREAAEQDPEAEDPYGEHWQKLMRGHSKTDLIKALENALRRAEKSRQGEQAADAEIERLRAENAALLESCKNLRRAAMFAYNLTSGQGAWYDESNEVEDESNAGVFLTIVRAEEEKLGILL